MENFTKFISKVNTKTSYIGYLCDYDGNPQYKESTPGNITPKTPKSNASSGKNLQTLIMPHKDIGIYTINFNNLKIDNKEYKEETTNDNEDIFFAQFVNEKINFCKYFESGKYNIIKSYKIKDIIGLDIKHSNINNNKLKDKNTEEKLLDSIVKIDFLNFCEDKCGCRYYLTCFHNNKPADRYLSKVKIYMNNKNAESINFFFEKIFKLLKVKISNFKNHSEKENLCMIENTNILNQKLQYVLIKENFLTLPFIKKKYLLYINPKGGKGLAIDVWNSVKDLFNNEKSFVDVEVFETKYEKHAYFTTLDLEDNNKYHGILCASGDGTIHEVVNAIMINKNKNGKDSFDIPVGVLPCGTSNALAKVVGFESGEDILTAKSAAYSILRGDTRKIDVLEIQSLDESKIYSFLSFTWCIVADCDLESEV